MKTLLPKFEVNPILYDKPNELTSGLSAKAFAAVILFGVLVYAGLFFAVNANANDETSPLVEAQLSAPEPIQSNNDLQGAPQSDANSNSSIENTLEQPAGKIELNTQVSDTFLEAQTVSQMRSAELLGESVVDASGQAVGYVHDLILNNDFQLHGVVISMGGFLGIGARNIALHWDSVELTQSVENPDLPSLVRLNINREQLENAPEYMTIVDVRNQQQAQLVAQQNQRMREQMQEALDSPVEPLNSLSN